MTAVSTWEAKMGRVSKEEIERLKAEISLEALVKAAGVELKRVGADLHGCCPFHEDRDPSLVISPGKNLWHCLGECQTGGSVIDWVMRAQGVSYRHALSILKEQSPSLAAQPPSQGGKIPSELAASEDDSKLLCRVKDFYHATLKQSEEARAYLKKRGLDHPDLIEHFQLGFGNRTLAYRLASKSTKEGTELRQQLQGLGVLRMTGHEHLNGSLVVPIFDEEGRVVEMYGRKVSRKLRKGTPHHLYLPGPHRGVFNARQLYEISRIGTQKEVLLCESLLDAMTFWCAGLQNVTASFGVEGFTDEHRELFVRLEIERVFIAYDADRAGNKAAEKLALQLSALGIECLRVEFPEGMDANEYATSQGPAKEALQAVLEAARPMQAAPQEARAPAPNKCPEGTEQRATSSTPSKSPPSSEPVPSGQLLQKPPGRVDAPPAKTPPPAPPQAEMIQATKRKVVGSEGAAEVDEPEENKDIIPSLVAQTEPSAGRLRYSAEGDEAKVKFGARSWRVRGVAKNKTPGILRINLFLSTKDGFFVDNLDLYSARHRAAFLREASAEVGAEERVLKADVGRVLLELELLQERLQQETKEGQSKAVELTDEEREEALELLRDPNLLGRIEQDLSRCGLVGEGKNKLLAYLAASSRKLEQPLAIVVQSSSAAGKSALMDAVLRMMPEEERVQYSAMTGQSLFYMGETNLSHKILAISEEEGAAQASYALKLLQSEGEVSIASTGKDPTTGRLITQEYRVEGPVMIFLTTTALEVDEELLNRCMVLTVDETREQTQAIHERQRRGQTLAGLLENQARSAVMKLHQNAQRLIRPLMVANPFAEELSFFDGQTRSRRDHMKYLTLIQSIALLHQHQREVKTVEHEGAKLHYIEVTRDDIAKADELSCGVLRNGEDQLPPKTRELLHQLAAMVSEQAAKRDLETADVHFTRRELREATQLGDTQLKLHLARLVEMEYLRVQRQGHAQRFVYSLLWAPLSAVEPSRASAESAPDGLTESKPDGGGRKPVGGTDRPVIVSNAAGLALPVGVRERSQSRAGRNGASYVAPSSSAFAVSAAGAAE